VTHIHVRKGSIIFKLILLFRVYSITSSSLTVSSLEESIVNSEREHQPFIVLYMVDPFHAESKLNNYPSIWSYVGLMKCFLEMRSDLNEYLKQNLLFEVCLLFLFPLCHLLFPIAVSLKG